MFIKKLNFKINDINYSLSISKNISKTILEVCLENGLYIPHFCYNKYLNIAGNCRICIIEVEKFIKPIISCLNICSENLSIYTNSFSIKKYRENILEFLLINHPLDCPICDQAGECDLQEQTIYYGLDKSRFFLKKKTNIDYYLNDFVKLTINRCILCLRCIRFLNIEKIENFLGVIGRGFYSKINLYNKNKIISIGSSNIIDICPVGALSLKFKQYSYRPWELIYFIFCDIFDIFSFNIRIELKNNNIIRILPLLDSIFYKDFISDLSRYKSIYYITLFLNTKEKINILIKDKFNNLFLNILNNCLFSLIELKNIFKNMKAKLKIYKSVLFNYFNYNNNYILNLKKINKKKEIIVNKNLINFMYRFFIFLYDINNKYKNIKFINIEDLKLLNFFNYFKNNNFINSIKENKNNNILYFYLYKILNIFNILLNFDDLFLYNFQNYIYKTNNIFFNILNFININIKNKMINIFNLKNFNFNFEKNLFNILGYNFINNQELVSLNILNIIFYLFNKNNFISKICLV